LPCAQCATLDEWWRRHGDAVTTR